MTITEIAKRARATFPGNKQEQLAYIRGFKDGMQDHAGTSKDFFTQLAEGLRKLWPAGEKDGKYPWRDSVANLSARLETLWTIRELKDYDLDYCLAAARRYLSQFETNAKYMQTLKYFILKQNKVIQKDGLIKYVNESKFADYLTDSTTEALQNEWEQALNELNFEEGEIL